MFSERCTHFSYACEVLNKDISKKTGQTPIKGAFITITNIWVGPFLMSGDASLPFKFSKSANNQNSRKILNFNFANIKRQMVPCKSTAEEVSFEWSHHRISSTDSKVRTTLHVSIIDYGSERFQSITFHVNLWSAITVVARA